MQDSVGNGAPSAHLGQILPCCSAPHLASDKALEISSPSGHLVHGGRGEKGTTYKGLPTSLQVSLDQ